MTLIIFEFLNIINSEFANNNCGNIAHGCGKLFSYRYTNSLEALENSYKNGYRKIEIDLSVIKDNHIVGSHDWIMFKNYTGLHTKDEVNISFIKNAKILTKYHIIYDFMLFNLLNKYTELYIVTDKISNYELLKKYTILTNRVYVEVSSYHNYNLAKRAGFKNVLINIVNRKDIIYLLSHINKSESIFGIVVGPNIFYSSKSYLFALFKKKIKIYVYDIDNTFDISSAFCKYVNGFYID